MSDLKTVPPVRSSLHSPVDGASLALFRILIGAMVLVDLAVNLRGFAPKLVLAKMHFSYPGFGWIPSDPGVLLYWLLGGLAIAALGLILGFWYRLSAGFLAVGYGYVFLLDAAYYSNNSYWLLLATVLLALLPAHRAWSMDARRNHWSGTVPRWMLLGAVFFTAVPLVYMGLVRLNADWLVGTPFRTWFRNAAHNNWGDAELLKLRWTALTWSYFGLLLHLAIVPMLLWRSTRWIGLGLFALYYAGLSVAFKHFIFPLPAVAGFVLFFAPDWPRRALARIRRSDGASPATAGEIPAEGPKDRYLAVAVAAFLAFHVLFPARALLYPGVSAWTGDGYRFAWRTLLDQKSCKAHFALYDPATGKTTSMFPRDWLDNAQTSELPARPDLILQFAHFLAERFTRADAVAAPEVYTDTRCTLNGSPRQQLIDPKLDLAKIEPAVIQATDWVLPFAPPGDAVPPPAASGP